MADSHVLDHRVDTLDLFLAAIRNLSVWESQANHVLADSDMQDVSPGKLTILYAVPTRL